VEDKYREDEDDFLRLQQEAGLDYLSNGLLRWQDIFRALVEASPGLEADGLLTGDV
jgi:methionine synthase II (cobalamin-independent)